MKRIKTGLLGLGRTGRIVAESLFKDPHDKLLQAINSAFKKGGRPDKLDDPKYIDEQDIAQWIVPQLNLECEYIEIERD